MRSLIQSLLFMHESIRWSDGLCLIMVRRPRHWLSVLQCISYVSLASSLSYVVLPVQLLASRQASNGTVRRGPSSTFRQCAVCLRSRSCFPGARATRVCEAERSALLVRVAR